MGTIKILQEIALLAMQTGIVILICIILFWVARWSLDECHERKKTQAEQRRLQKQMDDIKEQVRQKVN